MDQRPELNKNIAVRDFTDFYWLKEELISFCKAEGLPKSGSKIEIADRITHYLQTGNKGPVKPKAKVKPKSKFDWNNADLTHQTKITDNYKSTENVRHFFSQHLGSSFKFNVKFMNWMKNNPGKTLEDAIHTWKQIKAQSKSQKSPKNIAPQFEYNTYIRDCLAENPHLKREDAIRLWKMKKTKRGDNVYHVRDLQWIQ